MNKQIRTDSNRIQNNNRFRNTMRDAESVTIQSLVFAQSAENIVSLAHTAENKEMKRMQITRKKHTVESTHTLIRWLCFFHSHDVLHCLCVCQIESFRSDVKIESVVSSTATAATIESNRHIDTLEIVL